MADASEAPSRICVFCSTVSGVSSAHLAAAHALAEAMHLHGISLVYGGGTTGMMGELARTLVKLSGPDAVCGYIPEAIISSERPEDTNIKVRNEKKKSKSGWVERLLGTQRQSASSRAQTESALLSEEVYGRITTTKDMPERKRMMAKEIATGGPGSGFIGLSGGFGTMDELMEVATWHQFGVHKRGTCLYNVEGYWDGIVSWVEHAIGAGFVREEGRKILVSRTSAEDCIQWLKEADGGLVTGWNRP